MTANNTQDVTPEQLKRMDEVRDYWEKVALSCEPADRKRAEAAIETVYKLIDQPPVNEFYWFDSPLAAIKKIMEMMRQREPEEYQNKTNEELFNLVQNSVIYGQHEAAWLAFYDYFRDVVPEAENLEGLMEISKSCAWWWPFDDCVVFCERPKAVHFDERGRLHFGDGPAIEWRDGNKLYYWHGVNIPENWIENKTDPELAKLALNWSNIEQRRCLTEIIGWASVMDQLNPVVVDADPDPQVGTLLRVKLDGRFEQFLRVKCGTGRDFVIPVSSRAKTALEANAETYRVPPEVIRELQFRT